jgi:hypothetical protein
MKKVLSLMLIAILVSSAATAFACPLSGKKDKAGHHQAAEE